MFHYALITVCFVVVNPKSIGLNLKKNKQN